MEPGSTLQDTLQKREVPSSWMEALLVFLCMMIIFIFGLILLLGQSSREDVIAHWAERRCDLDILLSAFYYKPPGDSRSASEFTSENFSFCVGSKTEEYLKSLFGALYEVMKKQMGAATILTEVIQVLKTQMSSIYTPFSKMMNSFWNRFRQIGSLGSRIFQHLFMSMKKASGVAIGTIFIGLSLQTALLNTVDFIIKVIMIVLYIMIALAVILFIPILPVMAFVFLAVNGIEDILPGKTGTMGAIFCFAESTDVVLHNGTTRSIKELTVGDVLLDGQVVEAHLELMRPVAPLYCLYGVYVSGDHRVWYPPTKRWCLVKDHPNAIKSSYTPDKLWSLITTNREIPVKGLGEFLIFADWEEIPDTQEAGRVWEFIVRSILPTSSTTIPMDPPCISYDFKVKKFQGGWIPISTIKEGDWILGRHTWTKVLGICHRQCLGGIGEKKSRMTDGVWILKGSLWDHSHEPSDSNPWKGIHLITDEGAYRIQDYTNEWLIRDFTEVGWLRLPETYTRVEELMSKSPQKR
jgi:hypothetical protein